MVTKNSPKKAIEYICKKCNFITSKKCNYDSHLLTAKHIKVTNVTKCYNSDEKNSTQHKCSGCSKIYKSRMGLWRHNRACSACSAAPAPVTIVESDIASLSASTVLNILKENQEFKTLLVEQNKLMNKMVEITQQQISCPTTINNITNPVTNNNQKFNLNFFLNETCKDAMSIQEFIDNVRITFEDLNAIGNTGFVSGVTDILVKQLRDLEVNKRPIHCTDSKRETIYLKDQDVWNKDDKDKTKLKKIIEKLEYKNVAALHSWCGENPDSKINNTTNNLLRDKIYLQTLQGDSVTRDKIIKNIAKEVLVTREPQVIDDVTR
jgi:hypothetical protein